MMLSGLHPLAPIGVPLDRQQPFFRKPDTHHQQPHKASALTPPVLPLARANDAHPVGPAVTPQPAEAGQATPPQSPSSAAQPPPPPPPMDPRLMAMASRIAGYYQQRCQTITAAQQQRCQAWANLQRRKTHEMMHSAMLVVACYVRDRIQRKRRRQRRKFRKGLKQAQACRIRLTNAELVRSWAAQIPELLESPHVLLPEELKDREEVAFNVEDRDRSAARDRDMKMLEIAERMVRSQVKTKVDVPVFGSLSFDDTDMDSDTDSDVSEDEAQADGGDYRRALQQGVQELELAADEMYDEEDEEGEEDGEGEDEELDDDDENGEELTRDNKGLGSPMGDSNEEQAGSGSPPAVFTAAGTGSPRLEN